MYKRGGSWERTGRGPRVVLVGGLPAFFGRRDSLRLRLEDIEVALLREASIRFSAGLRPGIHRIPIPGGEHLAIKNPVGCEACGVLEVGPVSSVGGEPAVRRLRIEFPMPLVVLNPVEALSHLYRRYRDRDLVEWVNALPPPWKDWVHARAGRLRGQMPALAHAPVTVSLSGITLKPSSSDELFIRFAFSGRVHLESGISWPFSQVVLPASILPPFAVSLKDIHDLVSGGAGYSAGERGTVLRALWDLLAAVHGDFDAIIVPPVLAWEAKVPDRTRLCAEANFGNISLVLRGHLRAHVTRRGVTIRRSEAEVVVADEPGKCFRIEVRGQFLRDLKGHVFARVLPGSSWPEVHVSCEKGHPLTIGRERLSARVFGADVRGGVAIVRHKSGWDIAPWKSGIRLSARVQVAEPEAMVCRDDRVGVSVDEGRVSVVWRSAPWSLQIRTSGFMALSSRTLLAPLPEIGIHDPALRVDLAARVAGEVSLHHKAGLGLRLSAYGRAHLLRSVVEVDRRRLEVPAGAILTAFWEPLPGDPADRPVEVTWDLRGRSPVLHGLGRTVPLLAEDLLKGQILVQVSPAGRLSFRVGRSGPSSVGLLSTLFDPSSGPRRLADLLWSDSVISRIAAVIEVFRPDLARVVSRVWEWVCERRRLLRDVAAPADVIPEPNMAKVLSIIIGGDERFAPRIQPLIRSIAEGRGLSRNEAQSILRDVISDDWDYEVSGFVRWLDLVLKASQPLPPPHPVETEPLATDPAYAWARQGFLSAAEVIQAADDPALSIEEQRRIAEAAPRMTLRQVEYVLERARGRWEQKTVRHIERVCKVKQRVEVVAREGGAGLAHAGQAAMIASLIGDAVGPLPGLGEGPTCREPGVLGPSDVAVLLQAGLSQPRQGTQDQVNSRLLMEYLRAQPAEFTREVFIEMGHQIESALAGVLFAFLRQDQDRMVEPLDLAAFLEEQLGVEVPRHSDYLAGGRLARESYFEELIRLARRILADAPPLLSRRAHIQEVRRPPCLHPRRCDAGLEREARAAIASAYRLAQRYDFSAYKDERGRRRCRQAFDTAFQACAAFLKEVPEGFTLPWFRKFWSRNEEALKVLSVVRAYEEDQDEVRRYIRVLSGRSDFRDRQDLLETVIGVIWARQEDRQALLGDPLVRLLIPVPEGPLRFTVIACMGVITDGEYGRELETAFERLKARRGVTVIRAHTGLFRPLEYNARVVSDAIRKATTPYGLLGYSQGCANALMAEHLLSTGTPDEQRLLEGLACRNLLFSAANGSVHGTSGERKFLQALVEGERLLKHYQATWSREAVEVLMRLLKTVLDAPEFLRTVAGAHSLTLERAILLHRDGQFRCDVPTSSTRGIATLDRLPEALLYLYHCHERLMPGAAHDSQVAVEEAVGRASRVRNLWTEAFARCNMESMPLALHHWAPVTAEVEPLTTALDREGAVYQCPKDLLVFPWVEVNVRFGRL